MSDAEQLTKENLLADKGCLLIHNSMCIEDTTKLREFVLALVECVEAFKELRADEWRVSPTWGPGEKREVIYDRGTTALAKMEAL